MALQTHKSKIYVRCYNGRWMARLFREATDGKLIGVYAHGASLNDALMAMHARLTQLHFAPGTVVPVYEETFWRLSK